MHIKPPDQMKRSQKISQRNKSNLDQRPREIENEERTHKSTLRQREPGAGSTNTEIEIQD